MLNGVHYDMHSYYEQLKIFNKENTRNKDEIIFKTKEILADIFSKCPITAWVLTTESLSKR